MFSYRLAVRCRLMVRTGRAALAALLAVLLVAATATPAIADTVVADGDNTTPVSANELKLGTVCVNSTASSDALVAVARSGSNEKHIFANSSTITVSAPSATAGLTASMGNPDTVKLPSNWESSQNLMSDAVSSTVTVKTGSSTGSSSGTVTYRAAGTSVEKQPITRDGTLKVSWTTSNTGPCAPAPADTTPPAVTVSFPSPMFGQNGWYNGKDNHPVAGTVTASDDSGVSSITCTDTLTGLTAGELVGGGTKTASRSLSVAGDGVHGIKCEAADAKGNSGAASGSVNTATLRIDATAPTVTPSAKTADGAAYTGAWTNQAVTASFACTDAHSGVVGTFPTSQTFSAQTISGSATQGCSDNAGNNGSATFSPVNIDKTLPLLSGEITTPVSGTDANLVDWYRTDVNVKWNASDVPSGVNTGSIPPDSTVTGEGRNRGAGPVTVNDLAGNTSLPASITGVNIDRKGPTITPSLSHVDGTAYSSGTWTNKAVKATYACADPQLADNANGSGVASCPSADVVNTDGANQSVTSGTAKDIANNTTPGATVSGISLDGQAPQTAAEISCTGNNGWCRGTTADVILTAADQAGLSGVKEIHYAVNGGQWLKANGGSTTVKVPLANNSGTGAVRYFAVDNAGNAEAENGVTLKYDNLAPTVTHVIDPKPNTSDWNNTDATVKFSATDDVGGSGVATITPDVKVTAETAGHVVKGEATDNAGNIGYDSATVKIDRTNPTITASVVPGPKTTKSASGWYNGPVTVSFTCADPAAANGATGSGIGIGTCPNPVTLSADGADQGASGSVTDLAGNTSALASVSGINIDSTPPVITIHGLDKVTYDLGSAPNLSCSATDAPSGLAGPCSGTLSGGNANGVGTFTYTATATDLAGNTATKTATYNVIYPWAGFLQPINDTAHQVGTTTSVFKAASTVPVKFQVKRADGTSVQLATAPLWLTPAKGSATSAAVDEAAYADLATTGTTYRWDGQQYHYNWGTTKSQAGNYWRIGTKLDDGQVHYVNIGLR